MPGLSEQELIKQILTELSARGHRGFRNNVGMGWAGDWSNGGDGSVLIRAARPLHAGLCEGSSDIIGWARDGRFLALEVKCGRTATTTAQKAFIACVLQAGGVAGIVRSMDDALTLLRGYGL